MEPFEAETEKACASRLPPDSSRPHSGAASSISYRSWAGSGLGKEMNNAATSSPMISATKEPVLSLYRTMQLIRLCEERLAKSHQRGLIHGACHTYVGQEAIAVGVCEHLRQDDVIFSTHRGHGHA